MVQSLQLGTVGEKGDQQAMRRLNRLPIIVAIIIIVLFLGVVVVGLSWRGLSPGRHGYVDSASSSPATSFGDRLKRGISDGIIGEPDAPQVFQTAPAPPQAGQKAMLAADQPVSNDVNRGSRLESDGEWRARLKREQDEQLYREAQRERMARMQARATSYDSPLKVNIVGIEAQSSRSDTSAQGRGNSTSANANDLYATAAQSGLLGQNVDPNGQAGKEAFFNQDIKDLGYLSNKVVPPISAFELKRGSVIPATLVTGLNSDLPGRITAQVSQNVYDSASGYRLLVPQGAKLFGRYDSKVSFGQERVLVIWTDLIFPNGSTLQIGAMAGTDAEGYGGFNDKVDRHLWRTFGSAALIAMIGAGIDMSVPQSSTLATQDTASDAARRNFAATFGQAAEQTISKNLNVQPTVQVRPGYVFNILVDQDIIFPSAYVGN